MVKKRCDICKNDYTDLRKHQQRVHGVARFGCPHCDATFTRIDNRNRHVAHNHPGAAVLVHVADSDEPIEDLPGRSFDNLESPRSSPGALVIDERNDVNSNDSVEPAAKAEDDDYDRMNAGSPSNEPGPSNRRRRKISGDSGNSKRRALSPVLIEETDDFDFDNENDEGTQLRRDIERQNWGLIRTHADESGHNYNIRLRSQGINELYPLLERLHQRQRFAYRLNVMPGLILRNIETGLLRYFRPGESNRTFANDRLITGAADFSKLISDIQAMDFEQIGFDERPDTKWVLQGLTNLTVAIFPVPSVPIGAPVILPNYIVNNRGLQNFIRDSHDHNYTDSKCAFRCLAQHQRESRRQGSRQRTVLSLDDHADFLYQNFHRNCLGVAAPPDEDFNGLTLLDLDKFEKFFKQPIWVYRLAPRIDKRMLVIKRKRKRTKAKRKAIRKQGLRGQRRRRKLPRNPFILDEAEEGPEEDDNAEVGGENSEQIDDDQEQQEAILQKRRELEADAIRKSRFSAELVRRPAKGIIRGAEKDTGALLLNVYDDGHAAHFSRISSMDFYAKCFSCSNDGCIRSFAHRKSLLRHIKTCKGATIKDLYPGNGFVIPFTIFEKLENLLGITVPEEDQYYPYCACFDMESYTDVADIQPFTRIVSPTPPLHPLPPVVEPESAMEPPADASELVKANWMKLKSRLGPSSDYCVINSPVPGQVQDALTGIAQLQPRTFRLVVAAFCDDHGKLAKRRVALSDEICNLADFQAFLPAVSNDQIKKVADSQKLLAVRIDAYLTKKPFTGKLVPASFSVATTVPAFENEETGQPKAFFELSDGDPRKLIKKLVDILYEFSTEAGKVIRHGIHGRILNDLTERWLNELVKMHEVLLNFIKEILPKLERKVSTLSNSIDRADAKMAEMRKERDDLLAKIQRLSAEAVVLGGALKMNEAESESLAEDSQSQSAEEEGQSDYRICLEEPKSIIRRLFKDLPTQVKTEYYHHRAMMYTIRDLYAELERWVHCLPVFGFNSGRFDLRLIREWLLPILKAREDEPVHVHDLPQEPAPSKLYLDTIYRKVRVTPLKRGNSYLSLSTNRLRFLDMAKFCAEGTSLDTWLKSQEAKMQKFFWPHDYFTGLHVLDDPLPTREDFFSQLKNEGLSEKEYALVVDKWRTENWTCLREHLEYYNNMDVLPFLEGIENMRGSFRTEFGVDVLGGQCITLPGLAERCLYKQIPRHINFVLPQRTRGKNNSDLFEIIRRDTVGGPAIVNRRLAIAGTDRIRDPVDGEIIQKIVGFDANSLYPWSSAQPQATQIPKRWDLQPDGSFLGQRFYNKTQSETEFIEWESFCRGDVPIYHRFNGGIQLFGRKSPRNPSEEKLEFDESEMKELRIMGIRVDGYCPKTKTCFFFDGCLYHGHGCPVKYTTRNPMSERSEAERLKGNQARIRDQAQRKALIEAGFEVVVMTECEWTHQKKENPTPMDYLAARHLEMHEREFYTHHSPDAYKEAQPKDSNNLNLKDFLAKYFVLPKHPKFDGFNKILDEIRKDKFFGIVVCDLHVPEELRAHYAEQPPIFKNAEVSLDDIGEHMRGLAIQHGWLRRPQRTLVGSYKCTEMAIITPLLKWYLEPEHGLVCTKIYQAFEFKPMSPFTDFVETAANKRRESDINEDLAANANTWKLLINSIYGKSITNKDRFEDTFVFDQTTAEEKAVQKLFRRQIQLDNDLVEVSMAKKEVVHNLNAMFGFFVYGYSKMRMLQFHFDFVMKFVPPERIELILQDTDSHYYAIAGDCIDDLVPDELKTAYLAEKYNFLPHEDEPRKTFDSRTPGIFKIERTAKGVAALSAKCHCLLDFDDQSIAKHKGVSHRQNKFIMKHYQDVLNTTRSISGNVELIATSPDSRGLVRQSTTKKALSYSYFKRRVQVDGIRTLPILILHYHK